MSLTAVEGKWLVSWFNYLDAMNDHRAKAILARLDALTKQTDDPRMDRVLNLLEKIMSAIADFKTQMDAHNAAIDTGLNGLATDITELKAQITALQNSAGHITPEDQAILDTIEQKAGQIASKVTALDGLTPPAPPAP